MEKDQDLLFCLNDYVEGIIWNELEAKDFSPKKMEKVFREIIEKHGFKRQDIFSPIIERICERMVREALTASYQEDFR